MQVLSYSRSTIYKLLSEGKLKAVGLNRSPRITREEIERFIREELRPHKF